MAITLDEFRTRIIEDGIAAAKRDYARPRDQAKREGAIAGFQACYNKSPNEIGQLLTKSLQALPQIRVDIESDQKTVDDYWYARCFAAEVEWVANCMSAVMVNQGISPIIPPTARGVMKAAEIVGVDM